MRMLFSQSTSEVWEKETMSEMKLGQLWGHSCGVSFVVVWVGQAGRRQHHHRERASDLACVYIHIHMGGQWARTDLLEDLHEDDVELVEEELLRLHARLVLGDVHHLPHDVVLDPLPLLRRQDLPPVQSSRSSVRGVCKYIMHAYIHAYIHTCAVYQIEAKKKAKQSTHRVLMVSSRICSPKKRVAGFLLCSSTASTRFLQRPPTGNK